ncbi:MAG: hypothetical protein MESAZ_00429 [Saezia sanguinis]
MAWLLVEVLLMVLDSIVRLCVCPVEKLSDNSATVLEAVLPEEVNRMLELRISVVMVVPLSPDATITPRSTDVVEVILKFNPFATSVGFA